MKVVSFFLIILWNNLQKKMVLLYTEQHNSIPAPTEGMRSPVAVCSWCDNLINTSNTSQVFIKHSRSEIHPELSGIYLNCFRAILNHYIKSSVALLLNLPFEIAFTAAMKFSINVTDVFSSKIPNTSSQTLHLFFLCRFLSFPSPPIFPSACSLSPSHRGIPVCSTFS